MKVFFFILNAFYLCHFTSTQTDVRLPPTIRKSPNTRSIHRFEENIKLECSAEGTPAVRYEWKKNSLELNTNNLHIRTESDGAVIILASVGIHDGYYQCFAKNRYGVAISNMTEVRLAFISYARFAYYVSQKTVVVGNAFHIQGEQKESFPDPTYDWASEKSGDKLFDRIVFTKRIQMSENGDLHFACVLPEDDLDGAWYTCLRINNFMGVTVKGCITHLKVTRTGNISESAPTLAFSSEAQIVALIGGGVTLRCFFYGYPVPDISWIGPMKPFPMGKFSLTNFETRLQINNVTALDEGEYNCTGTNAEGNSTHTIQLRVEAVPKFRNTRYGLRNINVTEGKSVTFICDPFAIPEANIVWLQNGQLIDSINPPSRFEFSNGNTNLTIRNVCRDCFDRESKTDLMVIQCNASNVHGFAFAQGYLNVLMKTKVTISGSKEVSVDLLRKQELLFHCHVTSDPGTTAKVQWFKIEPYGDPVHDEPPFIFVEQNEFLIIVFYPNCSANCNKYLGEYRCDGGNGYSKESRKIKVSYQYKPKSEAFGQSGQMSISWKMILVTGAIALILFLFGIFFGFLSNRRSGKVKRRMKNRKVPNPPTVQGHEGYDSDSIPVEGMGRNERLLERESSTYEYINYATFRQMLEEKGRTGGTMSRPSGAHAYNRNESIDSSNKGAVSKPRIGSRLDEDDMYDDTRRSVYLEEEATNCEKINQQQQLITDSESVQKESEKFPNSNEQSEATKSCLNLDRMEEHSYLELFPSDGHNYVDMSSKDVEPYMNMDGKEMNAPVNHVGRHEANTFMDMDKKKVNSSSTVDDLYFNMDQEEAKL